MDTSPIDKVKAPQHFKTPRSHLLLRLVAFFLVLRGSFGLELLDVCQVLLHVREHFFFLYNPCNFLLLFPFYGLDAFPLDLNRGGFLFGGLLQRTFLTGRQTTGPLVRRRLPHEVGSSTFNQGYFVLPPLLEEFISTMGKFGAFHAPPERPLVARLELLHRDAAVEACF